MKTSFKMLVLAALSFVGIAQVQAQQTNLVQNFSVQLFGFSQGGVSHFGTIIETNVNVARIDTRQIIQALGAAEGYNYSTSAKLVVVTPLGGGSPVIQVRDGNNTPVDVTDFFVLQALSDSVNSGIFNTRTGRGTSLSYSVARFTLQDARGETLNVHFDVNGITTSNSTTPTSGPQAPTVDANVVGSGDRNGTEVILQGSIDIFGRTVEVVSGGGVS